MDSWLPSWLGKIQMLVKCIRFYTYFGFCHLKYTFIFPVKVGQSRDKILYILLALVFYPIMMVAS